MRLVFGPSVMGVGRGQAGGGKVGGQNSAKVVFKGSSWPWPWTSTARRSNRELTTRQGRQGRRSGNRYNLASLSL
jgi:hypothetical protein